MSSIEYAGWNNPGFQLGYGKLRRQVSWLGKSGYMTHIIWDWKYSMEVQYVVFCLYVLAGSEISIFFTKEFSNLRAS